MSAHEHTWEPMAKTTKQWIMICHGDHGCQAVKEVTETEWKGPRDQRACEHHWNISIDSCLGCHRLQGVHPILSPTEERLGKRIVEAVAAMFSAPPRFEGSGGIPGSWCAGSSPWLIPPCAAETTEAHEERLRAVGLKALKSETP